MEYSCLKSEVQQTGQAILKIARETKNTGSEEFLTEVLDKLSNEEFYLAILGLFKRGKSTLINALLGGQIVPTGVIPVTSAITRIKYGGDLKSKIIFGNGSEKSVPIEALREYVTEAGNPNNVKNVAIADVYVPSPLLKDGLILIDTPGVGSTYLSGTNITFQFLDRVDFAVFVLAVDPPVGQQEIELLSSLAAKSNKILFILNKIDYVDAGAVDESIRYCQKVISEHLGQNNPSIVIYPISAKLALDGRLHENLDQVQKSEIEKFETALKQLLLNEKETLIVKSAWKKLQKSAEDLKDYIDLELNSLKMPSENLSRLLSEFEQYLVTVEHRKRELFYVLEGRVKEIIGMLDEDLALFKKENEMTLVNKVEAFAEEKLHSKSENSREVVSAVEDFIKKSIMDVYGEFISKEDVIIGNAFQQLTSEANEKLNSLVGEVKQKAAKLFGLEAISSTSSVSLNYENKFYYRLDPIFTDRITFSGGEIAEWLLPKSLFKGILQKKIQESVKDGFETNGGRIRYDYFIIRINQAVLQLKKDINRTLSSSTEAVKRAVQEAERLQTKNATEIFTSVLVLNRLLSQLQAAQHQAIIKQLGPEFEHFREGPPTGL